MSKWLPFILLIFVSTSAYALRIQRPPVLSHPITEEQVAELNKFLDNIWNIQNGRFELDVVTAPKTGARNGEVWLIQTGANVRIQWKAQGIIYTSP